MALSCNGTRRLRLPPHSRGHTKDARLQRQDLTTTGRLQVYFNRTPLLTVDCGTGNSAIARVYSTKFLGS